MRERPTLADSIVDNAIVQDGWVWWSWRIGPHARVHISTHIFLYLGGKIVVKIVRSKFAYTTSLLIFSIQRILYLTYFK